MNHLHELISLEFSEIDWFMVPAQNGSLNDCNIEDFIDIYHFIVRTAPLCQCFDIGTNMTFNGLKPIEELAVLPYRYCWFEVGISSDWSKSTSKSTLTVCIMLQKTNNDKMQIVWFSRGHHNGFTSWSFDGLSEFMDFKNGGNYSYYPNDEKTALSARLNRRLIATFLSAINCTNVRKVKHNPPVKLQKARKKRGKIPFFSYYTLELNGRAEPGSSLGGKHASPRIHLRRGHPRQYRPGKWTWVQPCVVGGTDFGIIHKNYASGKRLNHQSTDLTRQPER